MREQETREQETREQETREQGAPDPHARIRGSARAESAASGPLGAEIEKNTEVPATDRPVRALTGSKDESTWATDLNLLRRTLEGDAAAEEEFVQRMVCIPRFLQRFDARMGQPFDSHQIDDLSHEVAARVWRDRERFAGGSRLESWVFGYARHVFLEALGAERVRSGREGALESVSLEQPDDTTPIDTAVAMQLDAQIILDHVDALPERERVLIRMKLFDAASFTEIARRTGDDVSALKTRYYRAIQRIREKLNVAAAVSESGNRGSGNREERR